MPTQARAVATVDAILQAATYILTERGWDGLTTNSIADRAGVNIASLYQYFPSKEAVVAELQRRHVRDVRASLPKAEELRAKASLRELLEALVDACIREHRVAPRLHRVFAEELPRSARATLSSYEGELDELWGSCVTPFLEGVPDQAVAAFVVRVSLHALVHEAATERPALLASAGLRDEIVLLLESYLRRGRPALRSTRRALRAR